jgi:hypothetical protein
VRVPLNNRPTGAAKATIRTENVSAPVNPANFRLPEAAGFGIMGGFVRKAQSTQDESSDTGNLGYPSRASGGLRRTAAYFGAGALSRAGG